MRLLFLASLLAGCTLAADLADPPLAQLARWRDADRATIAAQPVVTPCPADNPACPRLHALRAEACLSLALEARAPGAACPGPAQAPQLDCAAEGYGAALAAGAEGAAVLQAGLAQALLCRAELDPHAIAAPRAARAAAAARQAPSPRDALYGAWAALIAARPGAGSDPARCRAAREAMTLAHRAGPPMQDRLLADAAMQLHQIPGCEESR